MAVAAEGGVRVLGHRELPDYTQEPVLVALDCEMCATTEDDRALLGLCLLDVHGEVLVQARAPFPPPSPCLPPRLPNIHKNSVGSITITTRQNFNVYGVSSPEQ